jgi:hypothetical protein
MARHIAFAVMAALAASCSSVLAIVGMLVPLGCDAGGLFIVTVIDASADAAEPEDAGTDAACLPSNPGPGLCTSAADCPVVSIDSCGFWTCPENNGGQSYCEWAVK